MSKPVLVVENIFKSFKTDHHVVNVLKGLSFDVFEGENVSLTGASGSGKSTLLSICAGLNQPDRGKVSLMGENLAKLSQDQLADLRAYKIGFIFQSFHLIPTLTVFENVMLPLELSGNKKDASNRVEELLESVGLKQRMSHFPNQLSGGEQQRVAFARAFINQPQILFADEPTGNLDFNTSKEITELLLVLTQKYNTTLVLVTHDRELAGLMQKQINLQSGKIEGLVQL
ncbi:MAG: ABC transporter ATP-binding protein [Lentisphaeria bacterium]|nr:ABC transporter ATP-binding protein [Lentisphaeria bacterium]